MGASGLSSRAIIGRFYETLAVEFGQSWISQIGMLFQSNQESETYKWLGMIPALREWIGGRQAKGFSENTLTITNKLYEATLEISVDDQRRDKTGQVEVRIDGLAARANAHWNSLLSALMLTGESATCYDGQFFFDTDHEEGSSGSQTNDLAVGDYSELNVTTAANPTANELADVILKMVQHFYTIKDNEGEPFNETANSFLVMVPVPFYASALQALTKSQLDTGSGTRDNPLLGSPFSLKLAANARLTWTTKLAMFRTDGRVKPFILQEEEAVKMDALAEGSELEFKERVHQYGVTALRNVGFGLWQHAMLATLS